MKTNDDELAAALSRTYVIIPMLNEEDSIARVLNDLPRVGQVIVVDNGSTDKSPAIAKEEGATVIHEPQRGYGKACLTGIAHVDHELSELEEPEKSERVVVFIDGDYSDHPEELVTLVGPIAEGAADFVVGSRSSGKRESGSMHFQAVFGNWLACSLMRLFWGAQFTDLGPFRAIRYTALKSLGMQDENFGWTVEMQIKAIQKGLVCLEVPVSYRCRIGSSKISGTISGTIRAGYKILYTIAKMRLA